tara:strand:- start:19653 stop:19799 length:147 start_codon:yes stop_codon:yes gene_type:complete
MKREQLYELALTPAFALVLLLAVNAIAGFEEAVLLGFVFILGRMDRSA